MPVNTEHRSFPTIFGRRSLSLTPHDSLLVRARRRLASDFLVVGVLFLVTASLYGLQFDYLTQDDLFFVYTDTGTHALALANYVNGRFISGAGFHLLSMFGEQIDRYWFFIQPFTYLAFSWFAYIFIARLCGKLSRVETVLYASVIIVFPYCIGLFSNKNNQLNAFIGFTAIAVAIHFFAKENIRQRLLFCLPLLFVAFASYQTLTYFFVIFVCAYSLINDRSNKAMLRTVAQGAAVYIGAAVIYFLAHKFISSWALVEMANTNNAPLMEFYGKLRSGLNDSAGLLKSSYYYFLTIVKVFIVPEPILPMFLKILAINVVVLPLFVKRQEQLVPEAEQTSTLWMRQGLMVLALILMLSSPVQLFIVDNWFSPRVLAQTGAIWAAFFLFSISLLPLNWKRAARATVCAVVIGLCFYTATTLYDLRRTMERDAQLAKEIVADLRSQEAFDTTKPLAIFGLLDAESSYMANTVSHFEINVSYFGKDWSKYEILEAATGVRFARADADFSADAETYCTGLPTLRRTYYQTAVTERGSILCLSNEEAPIESEPLTQHR